VSQVDRAHADPFGSTATSGQEAVVNKRRARPNAKDMPPAAERARTPPRAEIEHAALELFRREGSPHHRRGRRRRE